MYCIKCGVKLAASEKKCPLCGTVPYHPDIPFTGGISPYPFRRKKNKPAMNHYAIMMLIAVVCAVVILQLVMCNLLISGEFSWSYYAAGGVLLGYIVLVLPLWFRKPNPVIFVPCDFAAACMYLLGINIMTDGDWFFSMALPAVGIPAVIVTAVVTLIHYVRKGHFFIFGGAIIACGVYTSLLELFIYITYGAQKYIFWSVYPLSACFLLGMALIVIGICPSLRVRLKKKFFI